MADTVIICITTFQRPEMLQRLLDAIAAFETSADVSVLVADNDAQDRAGFDLCLALEGYRWPLTTVIAPDRGAAQARNVLIEYALMSGASFIAMINDDECPATDWLDQWLKAAHRPHAEAVQGSSLPGHTDGDRAALSLVAGNLLIHRSALESMTAPWSAPQLALSGAESQGRARLGWLLRRLTALVTQTGAVNWGLRKIG